MINYIYTRFILLSKVQEFWSYWKSKNVSFEQYKQLVLNKTNIDARLDIFINYQLPITAISAKKYHIFQFVPSSIYLPDYAKDALAEAQEKYSFIKVEYYDENTGMDYGSILLEYLKKKNIDNNINAALIRLDDDDLLHPNYFDIMSKYINDCFIGFGVSLSKGVDAFYENNKFTKFQKRRMPFNSQGLAYITKIVNGKYITPYSRVPGSHLVMDETCPTIIDGSNIAFLYAIHKKNFYYRTAVNYNDDNILQKFFNRPEKNEEMDKLFFNIFSQNGSQKID